MELSQKPVTFAFSRTNDRQAELLILKVKPVRDLDSGWPGRERMSMTNRSMRRSNRDLETSELKICDLIHESGFYQERASIDGKSNIAVGKIDEPIVAKARGGYFITQGNHRVFAAKEMGQLSVTCQIAQVNRQENVEAQDDIDCTDALRAGLLGFEGLRIVPADSDRERACEEEASEDDSILDDILNDLEI
jgi:hypothetical protein